MRNGGSSASARRREVIHLSIGPEACQVAAHWCNLQGLAATSGTCSPQVSHGSFQGYHVPRVLFVDRPQAFVRQQQRLFQQQDGNNSNADTANATANDTANTRTSLVWSNGPVERLDHQPTAAVAEQTNHRDGTGALEQFWQDASSLAYAPYSRYRTSSTTTTDKYQSASSSSGRHVVWDEDEPEIDEEEEERLRQRQLRQEREWYESTYQPLQQKLDDYWTDILAPVTTKKESQDNQPAADSKNPPTNSATKDASVKKEPTTIEVPWTDYYMPPYHPKSCLPLPQDSTADTAWDSYTNGLAGISSSWKEDDLFERLRTMLEDCDSCQGVVLLSSAGGWAAGMTGALLEELQDECPAAHRMVVSVQAASTSPDQAATIDTAETIATATTAPIPPPPNWHTLNVQRVRSQVEQGLALHQYKELAQVILPLQLQQQTSGWESAAHLAAGLEAVTLPYRLQQAGDRSLIGINSGQFYGSSSHGLPFGTAPHLTFREFVRQVKPSTQHCLLEMDMMLPLQRQQQQAAAANQQSFDTVLKAGTSIERDPRVQPSRRSAAVRQELPGTWMLPDGILTSMSPVAKAEGKQNFMDRSLHRHFALSTALRPNDKELSTAQYLTCLMEGAGPRFRPEQSMATVLQQSLVGDLTAGGYGAGSYWKRLWKNKESLAVLGNTTRRYSSLNETCLQMKEALQSSRLRGFYNRDVQQGALPEAEDCEEALSACWDLRDAYMPPDGSGLVES